jgi:Flp pilus assembly protein TadG
MRQQTALARDRQGFAAAEFAMVVPLWGFMVFALIQAMIFVYAYAGLQNGFGEGARRAAIWPRATTAQIQQSIAAGQFRMLAANTPAPTVTYGTVNGLDYVDITTTYNSRTIFLNTNIIKLTAKRRVYLP